MGVHAPYFHRAIEAAIDYVSWGIESVDWTVEMKICHGQIMKMALMGQGSICCSSPDEMGQTTISPFVLAPAPDLLPRRWPPPGTTDRRRSAPPPPWKMSFQI
ncbi:hypothetical protein ACLOJK_022882 [Asimina triloba]